MTTKKECGKYIVACRKFWEGVAEYRYYNLEVWATSAKHAENIAKKAGHKIQPYTSAYLTNEPQQEMSADDFILANYLIFA